MSAKVKDSVPKYGIFGPTRQLKHGIDMSKLSHADGAEMEFYTEELTDNFGGLLVGDAYFDTPDMMKCSSVFEDLASDNDSDDSSLPTFERLRLKMNDVTPCGSVRKIILSEGVECIVPAGSKVALHYHAFLEDMSEPFDSSYLQGKPVHITLGHGDVIPGLDLAVATMRKREKSRFMIEPGYAYGALGCAPRIPPNAQVLFEVELLNFSEPSVLEECVNEEESSSRPTFSKVVIAAKAERMEGNELFNQGSYLKAQRKFMRCINVLESVHLKNDDEEKEMFRVVEKAYQNMSLCALKLGNYGKALDAARRVLENSPDNAKALYVAGKSLRHMGNFGMARRYMLRARQVQPGSGDVRKELKLIDSTEETARKAEINMCRNMFRG